MDPVDFYSEVCLPEFYVENQSERSLTLVEDLNSMIPKSFTPKRNDFLLDLGCGPGNATKYLAKKLGFKKMIGVDASAPMLELFQDSLAKNQKAITLQRIDLRTEKVLVPDESVALILCQRVVLYLPQLDNLFSECKRVLKKGGLMVFNCVVHVEKGTGNIPWTGGCPAEATVFHRNTIMEFVHNLGSVVSKKTYNYGQISGVDTWEMLFVIKK